MNGWSENENLSRKNYNKSGNLLKIILRGSLNHSFIKSVELKHYILLHEKYVDPEGMILNNDHVTLMGLNKSHVWFSISTNKNVFDLREFPFTIMGQFLFSEKILIIDHATFYKIADKCSEPKGDCILIGETGRCGSTLLNQVFMIIKIILIF